MIKIPQKQRQSKSLIIKTIIQLINKSQLSPEVRQANLIALLPHYIENES